MSLPPLQSVFSSNLFSIIDSGDPLAVLQAVEAAVSSELRNSALAQAESVKRDTVQLNNLNGADFDTKLTNLANFKSPDGMYNLAKADAGASVQIPLPTNSTLQAELEASGFSLKTDERCFLTSQTYDPTGKLIASTDAHLGTVAEMTALTTGEIQPLPDVGFGGGDMVVTKVVASNGDATYYFFGVSTMSAVASIDDINNLKAAIDERRDALYGEITDGTSRMQAFSEHILDRLKAGQNLFAGRREEEYASAEKKQHASRQDAERKIERNRLDINRADQDILNPPPVKQAIAPELHLDSKGRRPGSGS